MDVERIVGSYVVEIGFRQAWPFLGLCDNRPSSAQETRLYIDASWTIESTTSIGGSADDIAWLTAAMALNGRTIDTARVDDNGSLRLTADSFSTSRPKGIRTRGPGDQCGHQEEGTGRVVYCSNPGVEWRPKGSPEQVSTHDFPDRQLGKAVPYGIYDVAANAGWVSVGIDHDTAAFAVESMRRWWNGTGRAATRGRADCW